MMMWKILYRCRNKERGEKYNEFFHNNDSYISDNSIFPVGIIVGIISNDVSNADNNSKIIDAIVAEYPGAIIINKTNEKNKGYIKFTDGSIYIYEYGNGIVIVKDIDNRDVKNIIQVQEWRERK